MTSTEHSPKKLKFSDMKLQVGQIVQLLVDGKDEHKHYTRLIGWVENEFLMLKVPRDNGWIVHLREGLSVEIRLFSGLSVFSFKSRINTLLLNPRNYMLMSFPMDIQSSPMRAHLRVRTSLPVEIISADLFPSDKNEYHLHDISGGGASVVGPKKLGELESTVKIGLSFELKATNTKEYCELTCSIQNIEPVHHNNKNNSHTEFQHGLKFNEPDALVALLVYELLEHKI